MMGAKHTQRTTTVTAHPEAATDATVKLAQEQAMYLKLGKQLVSMYDVVRPSSRQLYVSALIKGFLGGFGGVLGATIGISLLLYILSMLETIPYVEDISKALQNTIQQGTNQ